MITTTIRYIPRMAVALLTVAAVLLSSYSVASASTSYWYSGDRIEESWYATHPHTVSYNSLAVDVLSCGPCTRWLNSPTSGYISSGGQINHTPAAGSGNGVLSCKWDTIGSGSYQPLRCAKNGIIPT